MTFRISTRNITTILTTRRPTLTRVWRTDGVHLTSRWHPTLTSDLNVRMEGGPRP